MRAKLSLILYLVLVEVIAVYLIVTPAYSFQMSSSTTGYVRIASQAATQAMVAAQRSQTLAAVAPLISGTSAGSVAVRMIAGSVGWPLLGVTVGITLAMLYYDSTKRAAIKTAAATPGTWSIPGVSLPMPLVNSFVSLNQEYVLLCNSGLAGNCDPYASGFSLLTAAGYACVVSISNTNPPTSGTYLACTKGVAQSGVHAVQSDSTPATAPQVSTYLTNLPATDPNSIESNTLPVGAQVTPTPSDSTASTPISSTELTTQVVPATQVQPTDVVVDANATKPAGTQTTATQTQDATTTTTTTTNPDGSTTEEHTETATASCVSGNHEQRTFGGILQTHMDLWKGSGMLSALNLLKTLAWPTTVPTYSLQSTILGNFTLDFSAWSGMLTAIRSLIIAIAGFVAYRIVFVGSK